MKSHAATVESALMSVRKELRAHPRDTSQVTSTDQLYRVEQAMLEMLDDLREGRFACDPSGLGRMVTDSWPLNHELTKQVCEAVEAYADAVRSASA